MLTDLRLKGELEWLTGNGRRRSGHRPDLVVVMPSGIVAIEVELQRKADNRLRAILGLYGQWLSERRIGMCRMYTATSTRELARD